ncbi:MAG: DUF1653 domain-containing protein [Alphaproteobacteria bacterium]|nr:DUF1653 domain-containing protein [Alphaproteobacteria bacterium]
MKLGVYQHYKGPKYRVLGVVRHSETLEDLVYYECLYDNPNGQFWVRPKAMFTEVIEHQGQSMQRFTYVGD